MRLLLLVTLCLVVTFAYEVGRLSVNLELDETESTFVNSLMKGRRGLAWMIIPGPILGAGIIMLTGGFSFPPAYYVPRIGGALLLTVIGYELGRWWGFRHTGDAPS